jgi:hypothetical protein
MPIDLEDYKRSFHVIPHEITYFDEEGKEQKNTLNVKHKPLTQGWVNELRAIHRDVRRRAEELGSDLDAVIKREDELSNLNGDATDKQKEKLKRAIDADKQKLEVKAEEMGEYARRRYAEHLAPVLIDLDIRDKGEKVEPTADFLLSLDLDFLENISGTLVKKTKS